jgi:hypothetical protein
MLVVKTPRFTLVIDLGRLLVALVALKVLIG